MRTHITFADTPLFGEAMMDTGVWPGAANCSRFQYLTEGRFLHEMKADLISPSGRLAYLRMQWYGRRVDTLAQGGIIPKSEGRALIGDEGGIDYVIPLNGPFPPKLTAFQQRVIDDWKNSPERLRPAPWELRRGRKSGG